MFIRIADLNLSIFHAKDQCNLPSGLWEDGVCKKTFVKLYPLRAWPYAPMITTMYQCIPASGS